MKLRTFFFFSFALAFFFPPSNNWTTQTPVNRALTVTLQRLEPFVYSSHIKTLRKIDVQEETSTYT